MYVPYAQYPDEFLRRMYANVNLIVRTVGPPSHLASAVRGVVRDLDRDQPVANVRTLDDVLAMAVTQPQIQDAAADVFAGMALTLAGIGVYGLLAHSVAQRVNEFGVRMALGASPALVLHMVLRQGAMLAVIGVGGRTDRNDRGGARPGLGSIRRQPVGSARLGRIRRHAPRGRASGQLAAGPAGFTRRPGGGAERLNADSPSGDFERGLDAGAALGEPAVVVLPGNARWSAAVSSRRDTSSRCATKSLMPIAKCRGLALTLPKTTWLPSTSRRLIRSIGSGVGVCPPVTLSRQSTPLGRENPHRVERDRGAAGCLDDDVRGAGPLGHVGQRQIGVETYSAPSILATCARVDRQDPRGR